MELLIILVLYCILYTERFLNKEKYKGCLFIEPISAIAGLVALGTSVYQGIKGAKQKRQAAKLQAEADAAERSNLADARRMALTGLPEEQYQAALQNIYRSQSAGLGALRDRRSALAGVPALQQTTNDALLNLNAKDADARRQAERVSLNQANRASGLKGQQAADRLASGQALTGAAINNVFNAATYASVAGAGGSGGEGGGGGWLNGTRNGTFGTNSKGINNRALLGGGGLYGGNTGYGTASSALSGNTPTIPYASAY
jgi:hypothetical protein